MAEPLQEVFDRFQAGTAPTFRLMSMPELADRARRRRRWRRTGLLAAVLAVLVGGSAGSVAVASWIEEDTLPAPVVTTHTVTVPGGEGMDSVRVFFGGSATDVWALATDGCGDDTTPAPGCESALARSADGGRSWVAIPEPETTLTFAPRVYPRGGDHLFWRAISNGLWESHDAGRTWTAITDFNAVPADVSMGMGSGIEDYLREDLRIRCDFPVSGTGCEPGGARLVRAGEGPVSPQPDLGGRTPVEVAYAGDRAWLLGSGDAGTAAAVAFSADGGRTWGAPVTVDAHDLALTAAPDGSEAWLVVSDPGRAWRLRADGTVAEPVNLPGGHLKQHVVALGAGALALSGGSPGVLLWRDGETVPLIDEINTIRTEVLPDGAVLLHGDDGRYLVGPGTGPDRTWTVLDARR